MARKLIQAQLTACKSTLTTSRTLSMYLLHGLSLITEGLSEVMGTRVKGLHLLWVIYFMKEEVLIHCRRMLFLMTQTNTQD